MHDEPRYHVSLQIHIIEIMYLSKQISSEQRSFSEKRVRLRVASEEPRGPPPMKKQRSIAPSQTVKG